MKLMEETGVREYGKKLHILANGVVRVVGAIIFVILTWYAFRYTQYMIPGGAETPIEIRDSMKSNIFVSVVLVGLFVGLLELEKRVSARIQWRAMQVTLLVAMLWIGVTGMWWIQAVDRIPTGDQAFVYGGASYFLEGDYVFLESGGYCSMYPHQLGLIALVELLFLFVGPLNYFAFQVICVLFTVGIVYMGYRIVKEITTHTAVVLMYCVMMMGCLPMVFYTGWVYGDIPSIFFALMTEVMLLQYSKQKKNRYLVGIVVSILMGLLVRKNALILLVALCLVVGVHLIREMDKKLLLTLVLSIVLPTLAYQGVYKMYEIRAGHEMYDAIPTISWIAMGMQEDNGRYGWYNNYPKEVFYGNASNADFATVIIKEDMENRIEEFKEDIPYAWTFFKGKILSQWNEPLYQSIYFNGDYSNLQETVDPNSFVAKLSNDYFAKVLWICDRLQFWVYLGTACYFLFAVKKDSNILQHLLAVAMLGGFFFSIIWEAKARYILPYYITMFPCAVIGYEQMIRTAMMLFRRIKTQKQAEQKEEIEKAA